MPQELTLMAVHAHPDDEVLGTGGVLARYAAEGIRTVLVTCTNGEQGDDAGGRKPGDPGHDADGVARRRLAELAESAGHLAIGHVELLGHRDSGMVGWSGNDDPAAFANVPLEDAVAPLVALMEKYRPQVVVTYDEDGGYGHPDHIMAHRIAVAAAERCGVPDKLYYTAIPRSGVRRMIEGARELGIDLGFEPPDDFGTPDELVTTTVDVLAHAERKFKALEAHASQGENIFILKMPEDVRPFVLGQESFVRRFSRVPVPEDLEDDLFAGLR
ncbi:PIG-L family deacetylase [Actinomadura sp. WMMB 499]|uniref:PIG-L family deacetylase n=1 Tax=Actinomadura sp. WMMB 499 TaxID=1219491 RepID=UPI001245C86B|nr:PIG-L family deacetylase [Actinomadura sp. WMMB 499]QFG26367.1 GlcNAc-PI de-N-acetylase [Actinomadura sp. WMMB 499]